MLTEPRGMEAKGQEAKNSTARMVNATNGQAFHGLSRWVRVDKEVGGVGFFLKLLRLRAKKLVKVSIWSEKKLVKVGN